MKIFSHQRLQTLGSFFGKRLKFTQAMIEEFLFCNSNTPNADWSDNLFKDTKFFSSNFGNCNFRSSSFNNSHFHKADFQFSDFRDSHFWASTVRNTNFRHVNFSKSIFSTSFFQNCDFSHSDLSYAILPLPFYIGNSCNFQGANLFGAVFDEKFLMKIEGEPVFIPV